MVDILFNLINDFAFSPFTKLGCNKMSRSVFYLVSEVINVNVESISFEYRTTAGLILCPW